LLERPTRGAAPPIAEPERSEIPSPFLDFSMACSQENFAPFRRGEFAELGVRPA
jgi:hypothetical protein